MTLTLYQFPAVWDVFSASPFCAKLEAFIRWQQIPYEKLSVLRLKDAPKGKVPYIRDENGVLGDSQMVIEYLCRKYRCVPDASLTREQKAIARAVRYLCEEGLYRAMAYMRFVDPQGWATMQGVLFARKPAIVKWLVAPRIHAYVKKQLWQQGIARHSRDEIVATACADLGALSDLLGDTPYLFGHEMSTADLVVFSVVGNFITGPFDHEIAQHAQSLANLVQHTARIRQRCFV